MDARNLIEATSKIEREMRSPQRLFSSTPFKGRGRTMSAQRSGGLKFFTHKSAVGLVGEDALSMTTQIISGHNSPLPYMRKQDSGLLKINLEQNDLLTRLRAREHKLAQKELKASKLMHDFESRMEQVDNISHEEFQRMQTTIVEAN